MITDQGEPDQNQAQRNVYQTETNVNQEDMFSENYPYEIEDEGDFMGNESSDGGLSEEDLNTSDGELGNVRTSRILKRKLKLNTGVENGDKIPTIGIEAPSESQIVSQPLHQRSQKQHNVGGELLGGSIPQLPKSIPNSFASMESDRDCDDLQSGDEANVDDNLFHGEEHVLSKKKGRKYPIFNPKTDMKNVGLSIGLQFESKQILKDAIVRYSVENRLDLKWVRNEKRRVSVVCMNTENCPWRIWVGLNQGGYFQISRYNPKHECGMTFRNRQITDDWISREYFETFRRNPSYKLTDVAAEILKLYEVQVSQSMCIRARKKTLHRLDGSMVEHYDKLWSCKEELENRNPGSTVLLDHVCPDHSRGLFFRGVYICFDQVKIAFLQTCRPMLGIDGAFLKGIQKGELLAAVGKDGNNQIYPVAWAVVQVENKENWTWFLKNLIEDLDMREGFGWTIITDQQKGLLPAIKDLLPNVEHRMCARHIYSNQRKKYKGAEHRRLFWRIAKAYTMNGFKKEFDELKELDSEAAEALLKTDPIHWCRAFFDTSVKVDNIENNIAEAFNGTIVAARSRSLIHMLEDIRLAMMVRIQLRKDWIVKHSYNICPRIRKKVELAKKDVKRWAVVFNGGDEFDVKHMDEGYVVNLRKRSCICRQWDLSGIPCSHALTSIYKIGHDPEKFISHWYTKHTFFTTYRHLLSPIAGENQWPQSTEQPLQPPPNKRMPGRPRTNRIKDPNEEKKKRVTKDDDPTRLTKKGGEIICSFCKVKGHNRRGCKSIKEAKERGDFVHIVANTSKRQKVTSNEGETCVATPNYTKARNKGARKASINGVGCANESGANEGFRLIVPHKKKGPLNWGNVNANTCGCSQGASGTTYANYPPQ